MADVVELRDFLYDRVYGSAYTRDEVEKAKKILSDLFSYVLINPGEYVKDFPAGDSLIRRAGDFIAGMTDLYAIALFQKLFFPRSWSD
jgi:dGTPase